MTPVEALVRLDRTMLGAFSRQTTDRLGVHLPIQLIRPWLDRFLALNVAKEVGKDGQTIRQAGQALAAGQMPDDTMVAALLRADREIDRAFLKQMAGLPVDILIRYEEIEPIRRQRIDRQLRAAYRVLEAWRPGTGVRTAFQSAYARADLEALLLDLMRLYGRETQALSLSLRLPLLLKPLREPLVGALVQTMNQAATLVARQAVGVIYRRVSAEAGAQP